MESNKTKDFKIITGFFWWYYYAVSFFKGILLKKDFLQINKYIFFIGYPRSGHSLIGSLLDAHPNIVISNELNALYFFRKKYSRHQIFYFILRNAKRYGIVGRSNSGYNYVVPNQWQGKYQKLIGIGDKKGGESSSIFGEENHLELLNKIKNISQAKLKIIHVIRNPYDNVSTMILRQVKKKGKELTDDLINKKIAIYLRRIETNARLKTLIPNDICDVHLEDFIAQPKKELSRIFQFLEIEITEDYLNDCASVIWDKTNQSRLNASFWTKERKQYFSDAIKQYVFLNRYNY